MNTQDAINLASQYLSTLENHTFDVLSISRPISVSSAVDLSRVISKLSPFLGNLIEINAVELLNRQSEFYQFGRWRRQDPGFPDIIFNGVIEPTPGFEIKAWIPLATEITARFKDSQNRFQSDQTYVAIVAWLPEYLVYGKPRILDLCIVSALSVAKARDAHYHNPPDYLIIEPGDTSQRTRNLQQTNTSGYKLQETSEEKIREAKNIVEGWGEEGLIYKPTKEYQERLNILRSHYKYRPDTNYPKMDRIAHPEIEEFKRRIYGTEFLGMTVGQWNKLLLSRRENEIKIALQTHLGIREESIDELFN